MDGIDAIDHRYACLLQCPLLDGTDGLLPHLGGAGTVIGGVEDRAHLVLADHGIQHRRIHLERFITEVGISTFTEQIDRELCHLTHLLLKGHLRHDAVYFSLNSLILIHA